MPSRPHLPPHRQALITLTRLLRPHRLYSHSPRLLSPAAFCVATASSASASNGAPAERARELHLYNTKSRRKELFQPWVPGGEVGMYVCGVTPYDDSHIGHARAYVAFDVLYKSPELHYFS
ncbi:hypothetical protein GUJ93_ZPchr0011g27128 [Zizania palustris]|uniref:tRNA synthetases class I catalytic domain-containing protein n=1 Tax=Zizania palustris TaxID=103762 RepID=A0A8J5WLF5_ZIZPA|nr:hypothetical protein GUJ93_ZPchr0011g27128 [Zizania palustris]